MTKTSYRVEVQRVDDGGKIRPNGWIPSRIDHESVVGAKQEADRWLKVSGKGEWVVRVLRVVEVTQVMRLSW